MTIIRSARYQYIATLVWFHQMLVAGLQSTWTEDLHMSNNIDQTITTQELEKFGVTLVHRYCPCDKTHRRVKVKKALGKCSSCGVHFYFKLKGVAYGHWDQVDGMLKQFDYNHASLLLKDHYKSVKV